MPPIKCIFCLETGLGTEEHVFPLAIGGSLTLWRVCGPCNSRLGSAADSALSNHLLVALSRARLRLPGNSGAVPEPLLEMLKDGHLASDPEQRIRPTIAADGRFEPILLYKKEPLMLGEQEAERITIDAREGRQRLPAIIARNRKRRGLKTLQPAEMQAEVDRLIETREKLDDSTVQGSFLLDLNPPARALLKIAYELAFLWLGEAYLDDPVAAALRAVVLDGKDPVEAGVQCRCVVGVAEPLALWRGAKDSHVAFAKSAGGRVELALKVFDAFSAVVVVSEDAGRYFARGQDWPGRFLRIDAATGERKDESYGAGLRSEVRALRQRYRRIAALASTSPLAMAVRPGPRKYRGGLPC
ncbi:MAG: HNH endonuclease [Allosphingosinicella sp.]